MDREHFPVLLLYHYFFREKEIMDFIVKRDKQLHMIVERSAFGAFLVALYLFASSDTDVIAQKPRALTAVGNERLFFTEFHFQCFSNKSGEFALDPLAILFAALYTDDKIICIADIFEFFYPFAPYREFSGVVCGALCTQLSYAPFPPPVSGQCGSKNF